MLYWNTAMYNMTAVAHNHKPTDYWHQFLVLADSKLKIFPLAAGGDQTKQSINSGLTFQANCQPIVRCQKWTYMLHVHSSVRPECVWAKLWLSLDCSLSFYC